MPTPFSIIIPTRCRPQSLKENLLQLSRLDYPVTAFEVIVVENAPVDASTREVVQKFRQKMKNFRYVSTPQRGASVGRNTGVAEAKYPHLVFIDDDVLVSATFLQGYDQAWKKYPNAGILGGRVLAAKERNRPFSSSEAQLLHFHTWCFGQFDQGETDRKLGIGEFLFSANISVKRPKGRSGALAHRLFDERLGCHFYLDDYLRGEDIELCTRYMLDEKEVIYVADEKLTMKNVVSQKRFTEEYILNRYFISGIELGIMEAVLNRKYPSFHSLFFEVVEPTKRVGKRLEFLTDKFKRTMLVSYYANKGYFQKTVAVNS